MNRLILLGVLLTVVYSWEDLKRFLWLIVRSKARNKKTTHSLKLDQFVATALMFATLPISLSYLLVSERSLSSKLLLMAGQMMLISVFVFGLEIFSNRMRRLSYATGAEKIAVVSYSLLGLVSPAIKWIDPWSIEKRLIIKFTFFLSLPALVGLALNYLTSWHLDSGLPNMDLLIRIAVMGLITIIAIEFLEKYFRLSRYATLFSFLRIVLGLLIGASLILNLN